MANNYTSIKVVADRLLRHPMMAGISFEAIIDYTVDFMRIVQCGGFFEEKCTNINIEQYKGLLPEDFYEVNQIRLKRQYIQVPRYIRVEETTEDGFVYDTMQYKQEGYDTVEYTTSNNGKPWHYVIIPHTLVDRSYSFNYILSQAKLK